MAMIRPLAGDEGILIQGLQVHALGDVIGADALSVALSTVKVIMVQVKVSVAMPARAFGGNLFFAPPRGN